MLYWQSVETPVLRRWLESKPVRVGCICAQVRDAYSRRVLGWAVGQRQDVELVERVLQMASHVGRPAQRPHGVVCRSRSPSAHKCPASPRCQGARWIEAQCVAHIRAKTWVGQCNYEQYLLRMSGRLQIGPSDGILTLQTSLSILSLPEGCYLYESCSLTTPYPQRGRVRQPPMSCNENLRIRVLLGPILRSLDGWVRKNHASPHGS